MGIRETLNEKSGLVIAAISALIVVAICFAVAQVHNRGHARAPKFATQCFYTTDDGASLFGDSVAAIPPFDHNGREAIRAYVFSCDEGKHQWVQYLEKYTEGGKKVAEACQNGTADSKTPNLFGGLVVKRPGDAQWVQKIGRGAQNIVIPSCPDGMGSGKIIEIYP